MKVYYKIYVKSYMNINGSELQEWKDLGSIQIYWKQEKDIYQGDHGYEEDTYIGNQFESEEDALKVLQDIKTNKKLQYCNYDYYDTFIIQKEYYF